MDLSMSSLQLDLRHALRSLRKRPVFAFVTIASIASAVGATTAVYNWLDNLVLRPLPLVPNVESLYALNGAAADGSTSGAPRIAFPHFREWRSQVRGIAGMAAASPLRLALRVDAVAHAQPVWGVLVTGEYFDVLQVMPTIGRTLRRADEDGALPVAVVSDRFWREQLAADPAVLTRSLTVNGAGVSIIGVMPPGFLGHDVGYGFDVWLPISLQLLVMTSGNLLTDRATRWLSGIARLAPGASLQETRSALDATAQRVSASLGERPLTGAALIPLREWRAGSIFAPLLSILLPITSLLLLLAAANVAGLNLLQAVSNQRDTGLRLALGGTARDVMRTFLTQSVLVIILGGTLGVLLARWLRGILIAMVPPTPQPVAFVLAFNWRIAAAAFVGTALALFLAGVIPAWRAAHASPLDVLRAGSAGFWTRRNLLQRVLVVLQVSIASVALVAATFFFKSLTATKQLDVGFSQPERLLLLGVDFNLAQLSAERGAVALREIADRLAAQPGVRSVSAATMVPLGAGGHRFAPTVVDGYVPQPAEDMALETSQVADGYFATMGIPIVNGREIRAEDRVGSAAVVVVNETFVRRYWPNQDPIGRRVDQGRGWASVVGVARDGRYDNIAEPSTPMIYWPLAQWYRPAVTLHVRTDADPKPMIESLRRVIQGINSAIPVVDPRTLAEHMQVSVFAQRIGSRALGVFGTMALMLALIGLYATIAFAVRREHRATAIRLCLGATSTRVARRVLSGALCLTGCGLVIGLAGGYVVTVQISDRLPGVRPSDVTAYATVALVALIGATLAALLPASRAARQEPMEVMRSE